MRDAVLKIVKSTRFDDVDYDLGYKYRGYNYDMQSGDDVFLVRVYDDEPGQATVVRPTSMSKNENLGKLVEFLRSELGVCRVLLYKEDVGSMSRLILMV